MGPSSTVCLEPAATSADSKPHVAAVVRPHYAALDGLRGVAITLVVIYHFFNPYRGFTASQGGVILQFAQMGWMGVDLFFVISGFLITGILLRTKSQPHYFRNFLARRFLRIWPLYYLSLVVLLIIVPRLIHQVSPEVHRMQEHQVWFWTYMANWLFASQGGFGTTSGGYFWSLAVEEQFYLFWPVLVWMLSTRALLLTTALLFASSLALRLLLAAYGVPLGTLYPMTITHWDGLAVGSALAVCLTQPHWLQRARTWMPPLALAGIVGLVVIRVIDGDFFFWNRYMMLYGLSLLALIFGSLVLRAACAAGHTRIARVCSSAWLTLTGRYSYALYLIHVPVMTILYPLCMRAFGSPDSGARYISAFAVAFVSATIVSWTASMASWFLLEQRILALKRYFE